MSAIPIERIPTSGLDYEAFRRATGEDLGTWSFRELEPGMHSLTVPEPERWCILGGQAQLRSEGVVEEVGPGCVVRFHAQAVTWSVAAKIHARVQTESSLARRDAFKLLLQRVQERGPGPLLGHFEDSSLDALSSWGEGAQVLFVCVDEGPLFREVFPLAQSARPRAHKLVRDAEFNPLMEDSGRVAQRWLDLERDGGLRCREEVFLRDGQRLLRWARHEPLASQDRPSPALPFANCRSGEDIGGEPIRQALLRLLGLQEPTPGGDSARVEDLIEVVLASLWGKDTPQFMFDYMTHPVEVPYPVTNLLVSRPVAFSRAFLDRWGLLSVASAGQALPVDRRVELDIPEMLAPGQAACRVRWFFEHETAEWLFQLELARDGVRVLSRELLAQGD